ncbi:hypothetical protein [Franconibacter helveticus]|uniref:protein YnhH n=1 Tax=Franconibacter helveticus TaxID=357240 RepID=UPI003BB960D6
MDCHNPNKPTGLSRLAEAQAHFPLHAWFMSPILIRLWHCQMSETDSHATASAPRERIFPILHQLKD